jgi:hypothetical protein
MSAADIRNYLERARDLFAGMKDLQKADIFASEDSLSEYRYSPGLLAIHSAISYSDALRTGMGCEDVSAEDHSSAAPDLRSRLALKRFEEVRGTKHLEFLIGRKNKVEYSRDAVRRAEIEEIVKRAERFARWAEEAGRNLQIVGW